MGHIVGKDIYVELGRKLDGLTLRTPMNKQFYAILKELYSAEEAELIVKMPYSLASFSKVQKVTGFEPVKLQLMLDEACNKGLIVDVKSKTKTYYIISPLAIGIFEYTMMRTQGNLRTKEWAKLFHEYIQMPGTMYEANFGHGEKISVMRTLPHEGTVMPSEYVEILDYEKADAIIRQSNKFSIGICSCRHEKMHVEEKYCATPLETCISLNGAADFLIRNKLAKEVSKEEILDNIQISRNLGLVMNADNVKNNPSFICQCCGCCCNLLLGINKFGYNNTVVSSNYIAEVNNETCTGCTKCEKACPVLAIEMQPISAEPDERRKKAIVHNEVCLGCGVCVLNCKPKAIMLAPRKQKVFMPTNTYERVILQALERGTLQNFIFDNPQNKTHAFMRNVVGAFLGLSPVKKVLMSEQLQSKFLKYLTAKS